ncbi:DUF6400 family protein [Kutzneria buriramensis]|uniref:Uncharacterized protein n=1 Tax=Kutzneria buriramensis TaxID=1045776 RepID=A0A3E0H2H8_9PSEU|nr:DUF6400 family protein [Kutzneria buriramensis]REH37244.1 hypothetical protein BCF44_115248 [Kutzneria buriramensis]
MDFFIDLEAEELRRRAEVIKAVGPDWDPAELLRGEMEAYRLLFSNLDPGQRAVYDQLVEAGVIPPYQD